MKNMKMKTMKIINCFFILLVIMGSIFAISNLCNIFWNQKNGSSKWNQLLTEYIQGSHKMNGLFDV